MASASLPQRLVQFLFAISSLIFTCQSSTSFELTSSESSNYYQDKLPSDTDISSDEWFKEKKLVKLLLSQQDGRQLGRPVSNHTQSVEVEFGINLIQVLRVNEESGQLITNIWTHFRWCDPSLAWNQTAIGVDIVRIPAEEIWTPDVALFNYADDRMRQHRSTLAVVNASGHIDWIPTGIFKSACSIDTFSFPFDEQLCYMTFRSLSNGVKTLTLKFVDGRESMSLDSYVPNPEWEISENTAIRSIKVGKRGMRTSFYDLTFTLRLKRRSVFHRYVLVLPCVLLSLTAGVLFMLPPESPAKIQIGIFIFQGFFLLLNLLRNSTPPSGSRSPIIGLYYSVSMIATTVVMFACGFLVEIHFRADRKAPMTDRLRKIVIHKLAQWLFIPIPAKSPLDLKREQKRDHHAGFSRRKSTVFYPPLPPRNTATPIPCSPDIIVNKEEDEEEEEEEENEAKTTRPPHRHYLTVELADRNRLSTWPANVIVRASAPTPLVNRELLMVPSPISTSIINDRHQSISRALSKASNYISCSTNRTKEQALIKRRKVKNREQQQQRSAASVNMLNDLVELRKTFQRVAEKQVAREYTDLVKREWLIAIMVFDRIFFFIYIMYIIGSLYMLLPQEEDVT